MALWLFRYSLILQIFSGIHKADFEAHKLLRIAKQSSLGNSCLFIITLLANSYGVIVKNLIFLIADSQTENMFF